MEGEGAAAAVGLLLGFLPAIIVGLLIAAVAIIIMLVTGLAWLLTKPISCWICAATLALNVVVLVPLAAASWVAAQYEPALWGDVRGIVWTFSLAFMMPTILFAALCRKAQDEAG